MMQKEIVMGDPFGLLEGKRCVVTGSGRGIGRGIAKACADAGAIVAVLDIHASQAHETAEAITSRNGQAISEACDVSDEASIARAVSTVEAQIGAPDVLINNAAIFRTGPLETFSLADWNATLAVNLTGYFLCSKHFAAPMLSRGAGTIVNVGSLSAEAVVPNMGPYSAAKAAITALTKQMAIEWGPRGIRTNVVHPGMIETPATAAAYVDSESRRARERAIPMGRIGTPEDIAGAVVFLASDLSAYVNGAELTVDGGFGRNLIGLVPRLPN
jgi:NAD(P)-dependent dehydrogenase (short-subunit alcohol dehydrogenase family)